MTTKPIITFEGVTKRFGKLAAVDNVSLTVNEGEFFALLGPSGCGKTTLLRMLAGFETPTEGRILIDGQDISNVPPNKRPVNMVFQSYAVFPHMTVADNVAYGLVVDKVGKAERDRRVEEALELVQLGGLGGRKPDQLSGGQRQRVALARALVKRPRVLLLDEPLTALDAKLKESLRDELADLLRRLHITAIHVTHDQQEALAIADRLAVMHAGQIVQVGDGETLYRAPTHPFVAQFLGRVNRLQRDAAASAQAVLMLGGLPLPCPAAVQAHTALLVRPEDIEVSALQTGWGQAEVTRRSFLGDRVQLVLSLADQPPLMADVPRDHPARTGDTVGVRIAPERLMPCHETSD